LLTEPLEIHKYLLTVVVDFFQVDEVKPVTNQKSSGRCWLFACLNAMRIPFIKDNNLEDFEFSQGFVFFWDKVKFLSHFRGLFNFLHLLLSRFLSVMKGI
jgi:aminopeptidase C